MNHVACTRFIGVGDGILLVSKNQALPLNETTAKAGDTQLRVINCTDMACKDCWFFVVLFLGITIKMIHEKASWKERGLGDGYLTSP